MVDMLDITNLPKWEPIRDSNGEPKRIVRRFPMKDVKIIYVNSSGKQASYTPFPDQRANCAVVFAPGINPLTVDTVRFSDIDYCSDGIMMAYVTCYEFKVDHELPEFKSPQAWIMNFQKHFGGWVS